jgi:putative MATE family efflux protein
MATGLIFCGSLLHLIRTPAEVFADSRLYLNIYIWGLPFVFFYNISTGIFSAMGDSRTPFIFLAASSTANILMDIWFVAFFHMGVAGVAWATFICQGISCILALFAVLKRLKGMKTEGKYRIFSWNICRKIAVIAVPSILQQSFISVGNILIQSVINGFGPGVMAGYSAAVKLNNLVITSFSTIGNGVSNYTAQNIGAGKPSRVSEGFRAGLKMVWILCIPLVLIYFLSGKTLLLLFMKSPSEAAVSSGLMFLRIVSPFYFVISSKLIADGILRGASRMAQFMIATFTDLILRVVLAFALSGTGLGDTGIWCAWPIGWSIATVLSITFYRKAFRAGNELRKE